MRLTNFYTSRSTNRRAHCGLTRRGVRAAGFTLIELMIVITIIMILMGMAAGRYEKETGPASLDDLVQAKYMGGIPIDPITRNKDWHLDFEDVLLTPEQTTPGLTDVHSSSDQTSPFENTAYSSW
jgi:general secretion pathway protein G